MGVLPLPTGRTYEEGFPLETGIPGFQDSVVPISGGTREDTIYSSTPSIGQRSQYQFQGATRTPPLHR